MGELDDIAKEFVTESRENLDRLDQDFVDLENNPQDKERLASIFRAVHTVKGTCGFLGFSKLELVAHAGENLLSKLRDGSLSLSGDMTNALLATVDAIREMLNIIDATGNDGDRDYPELRATLAGLQEGKGNIAQAPCVSAPVAKTPEDKASSLITPDWDPFAELEEAKSQAQQKQLEAEQKTPEPAPIQTSAPVVLAKPISEHPVSAETKTATPVTDTSIRVDVDLLDKLMNLVGELVLTRNQVVQFGGQFEDSSLSSALQRLSLITTDLQEGVMKTRMQPVGNAWSKFPRVVRDLALSCNKQIRLEMFGKETELDKSLIEAIRDPLTHMVRNAVDHGIETPEKRRQLGKPEEGTLTLRAYHEGGHVIIEISDDGAGIDKDKVILKAMEKNIISVSDARTMSDRDAINLLFMPGFSTAEKVTNVSGRGVGMDVVKTNIEKIGGAVDINNRPGHGSTFKVTIPLTLAIVPALIITSQDEKYAVPQMSLVELVRLDGKQVKTSVEMVGGAPVYRLRGKLLPLVCLRDVLSGGKGLQITERTKGSDLNIVVLQANDRQFGLVVDQVRDSQEIVVKPLGHLLHDLSIYAGVTILGDGKVALILDTAELAVIAGIDSKGNGHAHEGERINNSESSEEVHQLLVCTLADGGRVAIPLSLVTRLEKLDQSSIERTGNKHVVQYRNEIMPLIDVASALSESAHKSYFDTQNAEKTLVDVVVYTLRNQNVGLVVKSILDIVESSLSVQGKSSREGVVSTVALHDHVVEVLDINRLLRKADETTSVSQVN